MLIDKNNPHGGDIYRNKVSYDFSANISPLGTPDAVKKAICDTADSIYTYPDPYCYELRRAISDHENIPADHIICGNGAADLIFQFAFAVKPEHVLITAPTFCEYAQSLLNSGCKIFYHLLLRNNKFNLYDNIVDKIDGYYKIIYICNPNNPTGRAYNKELMTAIADKCRKTDTLLFADECFCDFTANPDKYSLTGQIADNPNIFILKAFTKSYGMAGARLGYALTSNTALLEKMCSLSQTWNVSSVAQKTGIAALGCADHIEKALRIIHDEREYLSSSLRNLNYTVYDSEVNFLLFKGDEKLYQELLDRGILIRNCGNFVGLNNSFYRCAVKTHEENIVLIKALGEINNG